MRVILFTGKGGVGKSTLAASTAALAASSGQRTLVLSTDAAHSLADAFGAPVGAEPTLVAPDLYVEQVDAQLRFEQSWADIQRYLLSVLDVAGMDPVAAEELTVIPGAEEVLALLELRLRAQSGEWDLIVVDCAPTAETLRLLALPEALGWYMARVFPMQRRLVKALKPVLTRAAGVPMPGETVFDALQRLHDELLEVRDLLSGPEASVRLVLTPETVVLAEARRSYTMLSLYGYRVDGVVANRVFPAEGADDWRAGWVVAQDEVLADVDASFPGLPVWRSVYRPREPVGVPALEALAQEVYTSAGSAGGAGQPVDPLAPPVGEGPFRVTRNATGAVAHLALPGATRDQVHLARNGDDLVVTVGSYRRLMTLPQGIARLRIAGARVEAGELQVRFMEGSARSGHATGEEEQ
ncbi:ArsA family ATPase [Nocardioides sp. CER19]|uniref:ArsA family ATPase n=1 Tax=Nocardioides sp. CER19 TaxID=3038538 RepID=UPI0024489575|nr:ArsA family ATPase [Nocardioides sp. CER19]MDH2416748.1 ArsA family ATPase [Nocardioides sp. CER19]